jgi:pumilio RNA-binding family
MGDMLDSVSGSKCLVECYAAARGEQLRAFQETLLTHAHIIAMGEHSNYFMQHALEHGDVETRRRLLDRLLGDGGGLVELALDCYGSYVAEACFQRTGMPCRVLAALLRLHDTQLAWLVRGKYSNYVVHKLLDFCKHVSTPSLLLVDLAPIIYVCVSESTHSARVQTFPVETMNLAWRIEALPRHVTDDMYARKVMRVIKNLFPPRYNRMYHA